MKEIEATFAQSFHYHSAGVDWCVVLVKQNPMTDFPVAFLLDGLTHLLQ